MIHRLFFLLLLARFVCAEETVDCEVVVYGGTPAGIMAAIAAARQGREVAFVELNAHVGGMVSGGLVATDMGDRATVGGLADDFFKRIVRYYSDKCGAGSKELNAARNGATFEPHVAWLVFERMLAKQPKITFRSPRRLFCTQMTWLNIMPCS